MAYSSVSLILVAAVVFCVNGVNPHTSAHARVTLFDRKGSNTSSNTTVPTPAPPPAFDSGDYINRVVNLLTDMQGAIAKDLKDEETAYGKLRCWCYDNQVGTGNNIKAGEEKIESLQTAIVELVAKSARLKAEIDAAQKSYDEDVKSLDELIAIRERQKADYEKEDLLLTAQLDQLAAAISVLRKHATLALPQAAFSFLAVSKKGKNKKRGKDDPFDFGMGSAASRSLHQMMESDGLLGSDGDTAPTPSVGEAPKESWQQAGNYDSQLPASHPAVDDMASQLPASHPAVDDMDSQLPASHPVAEDMSSEMPHVTPPEQEFSSQMTASISKPFLARMDPSDSSTPGWSDEDTVTIRKAMHVVNAYIQRNPQGSHSFVQGSFVPGTGTQGDEIIGILKQMHDQFESDQESATAAENDAVQKHNDLRSTKETELGHDKAQLDQKKDEKTATDVDLAGKRLDVTETKEVNRGQKELLASFDKKCEEEQTAYASRTALRNDEKQAISQALLVLCPDCNGHAAASFLQISIKTQKQAKARSKAASILRHVAKRSHNVDMTTLATSVQLDAFVVVKEELDKMIAQLKKDQKDEAETNDACENEIHALGLGNNKLGQKIKVAARKITLQEAKIKDEEAAQAKVSQNIATLDASFEAATKARDQEKADAETLRVTQQNTADVLLEALKRLALFYGDTSKVSLLHTAQEGEHIVAGTHATSGANQTALNEPPQMKEYKDKGGKSVMSLIQKLYFDVKKMLADNKAEEDAAVQSYSDEKSAYEKTKEGLAKEMARLTGSVATLNEAKQEMDGAQKGDQDQLTADKGYLEAKQAECKDLVDNFAKSQEARQKEIEALQQSKQILSGASFD